MQNPHCVGWRDFQLVPVAVARLDDEVLGNDLREFPCDVPSGLASAGVHWMVRVYWCSPWACPGTVGLVDVGRTSPTTGSLRDGILLLLCLTLLPLGTSCLDSVVSLEMEKSELILSVVVVEVAELDS